MAEHVGARNFSAFLRQVYDLLEDDGLFVLQYPCLRKPWKYEDLCWGLFMSKYIFPGADARTPLGWTVTSLEGGGFELFLLMILASIIRPHSGDGTGIGLPTRKKS